MSIIRKRSPHLTGDPQLSSFDDDSRISRTSKTRAMSTPNLLPVQRYSLVRIGIMKTHTLNKPCINEAIQELPSKSTFSIVTSPTSPLEKLISNSRSDIPHGPDTFFLLNSILLKNPVFTLPVPQTIVSNFGFSTPVYVVYDNRLKFLKLCEDSDVLKRRLLDIAGGAVERKNGFPIFVSKYRGHKRPNFTIQELFETLPSTDIDWVIQKYVKPRGLKAIKYRVIVNTMRRVVIFSNKFRIDSKSDHYAQSVVRKDKKSSNIERTLVLHKDITKGIRRHQELNELQDIGRFNKDKAQIFNIFLDDNHERKSLPKVKESMIKASTRCFTHKDSEKTDYYEGKNQSFAEIIKITEYLRDNIDFYYLDNSKLVELAVDFLQDISGNWVLLKIKYGLTELKDAPKKKSSHPQLKRKKFILKSVVSLTKFGTSTDY